jgi:hypothetical protein
MIATVETPFVAQELWEEIRKLGHDIAGSWRGSQWDELPPQVREDWIAAVERALR